ncbi:MAG: hypothetical protein LBG15_04895 [Dysgonamonadaceae bacterium]|jgi:hypothetical protein|nr:hypothetical protein [Dysgonamonadaceae bacterium]
MNNVISNLFKYYSRFVPKESLKEIFIQPEHSRRAGYSEIEAEIMGSDNKSVIPEIERFILSVNENFVSEKIKNFNGIILFVEYGKHSIDHSVMKGIKELLSITVARNFSDANNDNLNEILLMNQCLEILERIIRTMYEEQNGPDFCANGE